MRTVLVGLPLGGHLALWHDEGPVSYWRVIASPPLRDRLGHGAVARSEVASRRFREVGLFNVENAVLFLPDRYRTTDGQASGVTVQLAPVVPEAARIAAEQDDLAELFRWIGAIALSAARRGEFLAVETGGWQIPFTPYVLMMAAMAPDYTWYSHVETGPIPSGAPVWRDQLPDASATSQVMRGPARTGTIAAAGHLASFAISTWQIHPLELGLSFGPSPFGPWPG
jgi:hypothetical protein